jgi:hypothetical protein
VSVEKVPQLMLGGVQGSGYKRARADGVRDSDRRYEIILPIRKVLPHDDSPNLVDTPFGLCWFLVGGPRQPVIQQQYNNWSPFRGGAWILSRIYLYSQSKAQTR